MKKENVVYPVFIKQDGKDYLVYVPDLEIYTEGDSVADAIYMARDAIGAKLVDYGDDGKSFPVSSTSEEAVAKAKEDADEDVDFSDGILTLVDVNVELYRVRMRNKAVKKNCTIPYWMSVEADRAGVNYSRALQDALVNMLDLAKA